MTQHLFDDLPARGKAPNSAANLIKWINQVERDLGVSSGRLSWIVASSIVVAALQRTSHTDDRLFLLKGGTLIELRLGLEARSTSDVDTLFRGNFDEMIDSLDETLAEEWGPFEFRRSDTEVVDAPRIVKPRRFTISLLIKGKTWRTIAVEVSASEGAAAHDGDWVEAPTLKHFGLDSPARLAALVLEYQVGQKLHACTDPHDPPAATNDRPRDLVDLLLVRDGFFEPDSDLTELRAACVDIFQTRAAELEARGLPVRHWPPTVVHHTHWDVDYADAASDCDFPLSIEEAVEAVNAWIVEIDRA